MVWHEAQPLLPIFSLPDTSAPYARHAELAGSLLQVHSGTTYQIEIGFAGTTTTVEASTWSEVLPIARTVTVPSGSETYVIPASAGGSETGYVLYAAAPGAVIEPGPSSTACIVVHASFVIVRGFTLRRCGTAGVYLAPESGTLHDVVIEGNDISGWGTVDPASGLGRDYEAAVGTRFGHERVERIVVQRNLLHHPATDTNTWYQASSACGPPTGPGYECHPEGPQAIVWFDSPGSNVIRYNRVFSDQDHRFNDVIGGGANFSFVGFPGSNSDVYANVFTDGWEDGIESEGGNHNVRIWGNFIDRTYVGIALATASIGPVYVFRNVRGDARVSDVDWSGAPLADDSSNMMHGGFVKTAPRRYRENGDGTIGPGDLLQETSANASSGTDSAGPILVFHNTVFQPQSGTTSSLNGSSALASAHQALIRNLWSRNNVLHFARPGWSFVDPLVPSDIGGAIPADTRVDLDYDLTNATNLGTPAPGSPSAAFEAHGWVGGVPSFATSDPQDLRLSPGTAGYDQGQILPGLNDGFVGAGPDLGAFEDGAPRLEFGEDAYRNRPPVAVADATIEPARVVLDATRSSDSDGWIREARWTDGSTPLGQGMILPVSLTPGAHTITLSVEDNAGGIGTANLSLRVEAGGGLVTDGGLGRDGEASAEAGAEQIDADPSARPANSALTTGRVSGGCACAATSSRASSLFDLAIACWAALLLGALRRAGDRVRCPATLLGERETPAGSLGAPPLAVKRALAQRRSIRRLAGSRRRPASRAPRE